MIDCQTEILSNKAAKRKPRSLRGDSTSSYDSYVETRLISDLIHTLHEQLPKKPRTNVKSALAELVTFLEGSIGQTSSSSSECYDSYLSTQLSTLRLLNDTFDIHSGFLVEGLAAENSVDDSTRLFFYSFFLEDFMNWLSTLHQSFNDLPIPLVTMEGILEVSSQTEHEVLQYLNTNCRSK